MRLTWIAPGFRISRKVTGLLFNVIPDERSRRNKAIDIRIEVA